MLFEVWDGRPAQQYIQIRKPDSTKLYLHVRKFTAVVQIIARNDASIQLHLLEMTRNTITLARNVA